MEDSLYILLGCTIDPSDQDYQAKTYFKSGVSVSNSEYERKLFNGFKNTGKDFVFVSAPVCGTWPLSSKQRIIKDFKCSEQLHPVKYNCTIGIRNCSKTKSLYKELKRIVKDNYKKKKIHIIACELHKPYLICLKRIKKKYKNIFTTTIVLDLPKHVNADSKFKRIIKGLENKKVISLASRFSDSYLCLTNALAELFKSFNKPIIVSEGIVELPNGCKLKDKSTNNNAHCLYIGKLDKRNGIEVILETAKLMPDVMFDICGTGDFDSNSISSVNNIKYHGFISQKEAELLIEESDIVLSPRIPSGEEYLAFSFPSKIFSYIGHRKPVITYMIPCYKDTIFEKAFFFPKDLKSSSLAETIRLVATNGFSTPADVYDYIISNYSPEKTVSNIINLSQ